MSLTPVATGDPHVAAHNLEREVINETIAELEALLGSIEARVATMLTDTASSVYTALEAGFLRGEIVTSSKWGAVGDNEVNDWQAIQDCLLAVGAQPGGGVVALPPKTFLMHSPSSLIIPSNVTFMGTGDQSVLNFTYVDLTTATHQIRNANPVSSGTDNHITIRDMKIMGASPGGPTGVPSSPGVTVLFQYVDEVHVNNVHFYRTRGPAVHFQGCTQVRALHNKIDDIGRGGIVCLGRSGRDLDDVLIVGNIITGVGDDAIACPQTSPSTGLGRNITIAGNTINGVYSLEDQFETADGGRGVLLLGVDTCTVVGNSIVNTASRAIVVQAHEVTLERSRNVTISGNACSHNGPVGSVQAAQGMYVSATDHVTLGPNNIGYTGGYGVYLVDCTHVTGGPINVHHSAELLAQGAIHIYGPLSADIDLWIDCYENAGPAVVITDGTRITLRGRAVDNCGAGTGTGATSAAVLLKTAGEVSLIGFRATDTRRQSARAASTADLTLSGTQTVDGVALVVGNRVLVKDQTIGSQNGIYVVAAGAWTRATDADTSAEVTSGMSVTVDEGTTNGNKVFALTTSAPITLDTTALVFTVSVGAPLVKKKQTYGIACTTLAPSRLTVIGGDYTGNLNEGFLFTTVPLTTIKRGVSESTDPGKNFDQDASGVRQRSGSITPEGNYADPPGSLYRRSDGSVWIKQTGTGTTGWAQVSTAKPTIWANLTADVTVNNDADVTQHNVLSTSQALEGSATYELEGLVEYSSDTAADIQFGWKSADMPGTTLSANIGGLQTLASGGQASILRNRQSLTSTTTIGGIGVGSRVLAPLKGKVTTGPTGGILTMQFAQGVAHASDTVLYAQGTFFKLVRVA